MATISVIIPVYNVEAFLPKCLDSLLAQTYRDWEAICVDDGSPDRCGEILDRYSAADSRFKVVHQKGGGVSAARNRAMEIAEGEWTMFLDSDDFLHPQAMEICLHFARKDGSDIVAYTYNRRYRTTRTIAQALHIPLRDPERFTIYNIPGIASRHADDIFDYATEYSKPRDIDRKWAVKHCQPWRCLYRSACIAGIKYEPGIMYEDFLWWSEVMLKAGGVTIINLPLYFYRPNLTGYIRSAKQEYRIKSLKICIAKAEQLYDSAASPAQKARWEKHFLAPFKAKLAEKLSRTGNADTSLPE